MQEPTDNGPGNLLAQLSKAHDAEPLQMPSRAHQLDLPFRMGPAEDQRIAMGAPRGRHLKLYI